jgi:hypothetical protein
VISSVNAITDAAARPTITTQRKTAASESFSGPEGVGLDLGAYCGSIYRLPSGNPSGLRPVPERPVSAAFGRSRSQADQAPFT